MYFFCFPSWQLQLTLIFSSDCGLAFTISSCSTTGIILKLRHMLEPFGFTVPDISPLDQGGNVNCFAVTRSTFHLRCNYNPVAITTLNREQGVEPHRMPLVPPADVVVPIHRAEAIKHSIFTDANAPSTSRLWIMF